MGGAAPEAKKSPRLSRNKSGGAGFKLPDLAVTGGAESPGHGQIDRCSSTFYTERFYLTHLIRVDRTGGTARAGRMHAAVGLVEVQP